MNFSMLVLYNKQSEKSWYLKKDYEYLKKDYEYLDVSSKNEGRSSRSHVVALTTNIMTNDRRSKRDFKWLD
jgi:hypothetical protein